MPEVVRHHVVVPLPEDVLREMASLRLSLESALPERSPRVVMFVASQIGEGTSTVAGQFAAAVTGEGRARALLVDLNARRPAHGGAADEEGVARLPESRESHGAAASVFDLLPLAQGQLESGRVSQNLTRQACETYGDRYDWVVLDGPPVLESPDSAALAAVADGVVIVVQAGRTKRPVLSRAVDLLRKAGARVVGTVLNRRRLEIPEFIYRRI